MEVSQHYPALTSKTLLLPLLFFILKVGKMTGPTRREKNVACWFALKLAESPFQKNLQE